MKERRKGREKGGRERRDGDRREGARERECMSVGSIVFEYI